MLVNESEYYNSVTLILTTIIYNCQRYGFKLILTNTHSTYILHTIALTHQEDPQYALDNFYPLQKCLLIIQLFIIDEYIIKPFIVYDFLLQLKPYSINLILTFLF